MPPADIAKAVTAVMAKVTVAIEMAITNLRMY
jgi:hypothetical protein